MVQHYRGDRQKISRSTPSTEGSDFAMVNSLRKTNANEARIAEVLASFSHLTKSAIRASLLELTVSDADALIAFSAGRIANDRIIIRRAASIIASSVLLSDEIRGVAKKYLSGKDVRTDILGLGIVKVRGANSRLKRN